MRILIRMKSIKNMLLNEAILGYVPSAVDPDRYCDQEFNLQIHLPRNYSKEDAERCVNSLRRLLFIFDEFDTTIKIIKHKPYDKAYFHHVSHEEVARIMHHGPIMLAFHVYNMHLVGCVKLGSRGIGNRHPLDILGEDEHGVYIQRFTPTM